ncbi:MAG: hypothetical protein WC496_06885 [Phycisphaerae bacterium]
MIHKSVFLTVIVLFLSGCSQNALISNKQPGFKIHNANKLKFSVPTDSGCPAHWSDNVFYIFASSEFAKRLSGPSLFNLKDDGFVKWDSDEKKSRWIEATYQDEDGTLYGWYHHEKGPVCRNRLPKYYAAPAIGQGVSHDNGATWFDMGFVIDDEPNSFNCDTLNKYFPGGSGDCSVIVDQKKEYIYFLFGTYGGDIEQQGISTARMLYNDRKQPGGKVWRWCDNGWTQPGINGRNSPIFPAVGDWHSTKPDAFWGPSVHWNTYLQSYVMILNHAIDPNFWQEGIYISFNKNLDNPAGWSEPQLLRKDGSWYPLIVGTDKKKHQTDKLAGKKARYFEQGVSLWEIEFFKPGEKIN